MKKSVAIGSMFGVSSIAGCTSESDDGPGSGDIEGDWPDLSDAEVHVLIDETNEAFQNFFDGVGNDFQQATGASVRNEYVAPGGPGEQRLSELVQSGDPPEVFLVGASQATTYIQQGTAGKVTGAIDSLIDQYGEPSDGARLISDGDDYMVPLWIHPGMNIYRDDLMSLPEKPTWEEQLDALRKVDQENEDMKGTFVGTGTGVPTWLNLVCYLYSNEGQIAVHEDGEFNAALDQEPHRKRWEETLSYYQDMFQYSVQRKGDIAGAHAQSLTSESSAHLTYFGSRPKVIAVEQNADFAKDLRFTYQAAPEGLNDPPLTGGLAEGLATFAESNVEAANVYMEFVTQGQYLADLLFNTPLHTLPTFPEVAESDAFRSRLDEMDSDIWTEKDKEITLSVPNNVQTPTTETSEPNPYIGPVLSSGDLQDMVLEVTHDGADPADVIDKYAPRIQQTLDDAQN